jgi:hypothetical protein
MAFITDYETDISEIEQCIRYCEGCCVTSIEAGMYWIEVTGEELAPAFFDRLAASVEIVKLSPDFLLAQDVELQKQVGEICAAVCDNCAETCTLLGKDDPFLQECAEFCAASARRCRTLIEMMGEYPVVWTPSMMSARTLQEFPAMQMN